MSSLPARNSLPFDYFYDLSETIKARLTQSNCDTPTVVSTESYYDLLSFQIDLLRR